MRPARRSIPRKRCPAPPAESRLTMPRAVTALRRSREAITAIERQLDALLVGLKASRIDAQAPDRLAGAARHASRALDDLSRLF